MSLLLGSSLPARAEIVEDGTCTPWPGGRWQPDPPSYGVELVTGVAIVMSDGVTLFADIGYPTDLATGQRAAGTFPVLLSENPYVFTPPPDGYFVSRGYIYVNADRRGTLRSEAPGGGPLTNDLFSERQAQDGAELVEWAANLDGSNGIVGLTGCSQLGISQIFTAAALAPGSPVKAILPACTGHSYLIYFAGGIPSQTIPLFGAGLPISGTKHLPENTAAGRELVAEVLAGGDRAYNRAHWQERDASRVAANIVRNGIPALLWTGWNANESNEGIKLYSLFQNAWLGRPPLGTMLPFQPTTARYQIIVGPGAHGQGLDKGIMLEWYDTWLKGQRTGLDESRSPMHLYELQTNRWVNTKTYPIVANYAPYYLGANGALAKQRPITSGRDSVAWGQPGVAGSTLTYTTQPFSHGATLAGPMSASIYASSSNTNMELIATLYDVAPDGAEAEITSGTLLGSMRALAGTHFGPEPLNRLQQLIAQLLGLNPSWYDLDGDLVLPSHPFEEDAYLTPGKVERMDIELFSMLWSVQPGHALRLVLSTQAPPAVCTSALGALAKPRACVLTAPQQATLPGGVYQIARSFAQASALNLPLLPFRSLKEVASAVTPTSPNQTQPLDWGAPRPPSCPTP
jgi:predicted acyl esterase